MQSGVARLTEMYHHLFKIAKSMLQVMINKHN